MSGLQSLLIATGNHGKEREIRRVMADLPLDWVTLRAFPLFPECEESGTTFAENARQKAAYYEAHTHVPTLADDSGLVVDALFGEPGIHSARYAGPNRSDADRIQKLLRELRLVPAPERTARFVCAVSLVWEGREIIAVEGSCDGVILAKPRGIGGFGYDPVFWVPEVGKTFAELDDTEKDALSHRGQALRRLREHLLPWCGR